MWELIHYVEHFDVVTYVDALLNVTQQQTATAFEWVSLLYMRVLINDQSFAYLTEGLATRPLQDATGLRQIMTAIANENDGDKFLELRRRAAFLASTI